MDYSNYISIILIFILFFVLVFQIYNLFYFKRFKNVKQDSDKNYDKSNNLYSEVIGRLSSLTETSSISQNELIKTLNNRIDNLSRDLNLNLQNNNFKTSESLGELKKHLNKIDEAQKNISELSSEMITLQNILSNKQTRGAFGEIQLNEIITNILPPAYYGFQETLSNGSRPDLVIKLPSPPGKIIVDAKFPLESYKKLNDSKNKSDRNIAIKQFKTDLKKHIKDISHKYIIAGETADSALMFIPSEGVYSEIHSSLEEIIEDSMKSKVWIVSPTTIWALLNTIRGLLKDVSIKKQAGVIQKEIISLIDDLGRLDLRVQKLQKHFSLANNDLNEIETSTNKLVSLSKKIENIKIEEN
tara:strand:+ start:494 stop:1564 length:1071 start_codon:yes stop_codon:yes gene_type:complete